MPRTICSGAAVGSAVVGVGAGAYAYQRARRPKWWSPSGRVVPTSSLSVRLLGDAGPPILLLHGLVASGIYWGGAYDALGVGHRLVVPDLLGFGRSPRLASGYGPDDHAEAVLACLNDVGIEEPVTIGAHSLGGLIALRLAASYPDRVRAVVAFGPPLYASTEAARAHVGATSPMGALFVLPGRTAEWACRWVCNHRTLAARLAVLANPSLPPTIVRDAVQHTWVSYSSTLQQMILAAEASSWLSEIGCPVRLVAGANDPVVDHQHLRQLADIYPNVTLDDRRGTHDLPLTDAAECSAAIAADETRAQVLRHAEVV